MNAAKMAEMRAEITALAAAIVHRLGPDYSGRNPLPAAAGYAELLTEELDKLRRMARED